MNKNPRMPRIHRLVSTFAVCALPLMLALSGCRHETPGGTNYAADRHERGTQVVTEYLRRDASPFRKLRIRLTIQDLDAKLPPLSSSSASGPLKIYELEIWRKQTEAETLTLTHVVYPADE